MSTIEELEAEVAAAGKRFSEASKDLNAAKRQLQIAINEASGIIGHVLEHTQEWGGHRVVRICVDRVGRSWCGKMVARGFVVLKSGALGMAREEFDVEWATDLGPYVAPAAEQEKSR